MAIAFCKAYWGALLISLLSLVGWGLTAARVRRQSSQPRASEQAPHRAFAAPAPTVLDESDLLPRDPQHDVRPENDAPHDPELTSPPAAPQSAERDEALGELCREIKETVHTQLRPIRDGLGQTRALVGDAVGKMSDSFHSTRTQAQNQATLVLSLIENLAGKTNRPETTQLSVQQFTEETTAALAFFVELIVEISKQSVETVYKIDDMVQQTETIFALLTDVRRIARQTKLLALNVSIEAARAGDGGQAFSVVAEEMRRLSECSRQLGEQISAQVEQATTTMAAARRTVAEVAAKDMNVGLTAKNRVDAMMHQLGEVNRGVSHSLETVSDMTGQIGESVSLAVRALQFEDIVSQLLESTSRKLDKLEDFVTDLVTQMAEVGAMKTATPADYEAQLGRIKADLVHLREDVEAEDHKSVHQESMDTGEVELFS